MIAYNHKCKAGHTYQKLVLGSKPPPCPTCIQMVEDAQARVEAIRRSMRSTEKRHYSYQAKSEDMPVTHFTFPDAVASVPDSSCESRRSSYSSGGGGDFGGGGASSSYDSSSDSSSSSSSGD